MNLRDTLKSILPQRLLPGNVGKLAEVQWPFFYEINFDLGNTPVIDSSTRQLRSFQVSQEAAFLLMGIERKSYSYDKGNELAPLQIEIRDRQSSRVLSDRPIPVQMFGKKSLMSVMPTPFLMMPTDFMDVTLSSWLTAPLTQTGTGSGKMGFMFFGYRVRVDQQGQVLNAMFG